MPGGGYTSACLLRHCGCHSSLACGECAIAICDDCADATGGVCRKHQEPAPGGRMVVLCPGHGAGLAP